MSYLFFAISLIFGYLIGSINGAVILSKTFYGSDIREHGSGNAGTTNMLRTFGKKAALFTLLIDLFKGVFACLIAFFFAKILGTGHEFFGCPMGTGHVLLAALGAVLGHNWPVYFNFHGGKGVLVSFSVMLFIAPVPALIALGIFIILVAITKYVSLGSIVAAAAFPALQYAIGGWLAGTKGFTAAFFVSIIVCAMMIIRHHANIKRLLTKSESKISFKK